jgi:hypothetical protein
VALIERFTVVCVLAEPHRIPLPDRTFKNQSGSASAWRAKRPYQASTLGVTNPSSLARQGTMAGTQVRWLNWSPPTRTGANSRERSASAALGHWPGCAS